PHCPLLFPYTTLFRSVPGVQRVRFLLGERVAEAEVELLRRLRNRLLVIERIAQHRERAPELRQRQRQHAADLRRIERHRRGRERSEEHTSELQSRVDL